MIIRTIAFSFCFLIYTSTASAALIQHYTFDADFADSAGSSDGNLVDVGTPGDSGITTNQGAFIVGSGALNLSADRDYVDIPSRTFGSGSAYTIAFWAKKAEVNAGWNMVIGQRSGTSFYIGLHDDFGVRRRSSDSSTRRQSDFATPDDTQWHHYTLTASAGADMSCYLDGEWIGTETNELTGFILDTIGEAYPDTSDFDFEGQIDDVRVYDERIDEQEILDLYLMGNPMRYYSFDVDFSDSVHTNHGVLVDVDTIGDSGITTNEADLAVGTGALNLSADRDYVQIPSHTFSSGTPYSLAFWAKKAPGDVGDAALWDMALGSLGGTTFFVGLNSGTGFRWRSNSSADTRQANFSAPDDTEWHHYGLVAEADGTLSYYLDGLVADVATNKQTGFIINTIGEAYSDARDFDFHGQLDEVYVYDRSVEAPQMQALFAARNTAPEEPVDYDVYLIGGQSNADGRGVTSELTGPLAVWNAEQPDVRIFYVNPLNEDPVNPSYNTGWTTLRPGLAAAPGFSGMLPSLNFGLELSFARTLADRSPDRRIALIKVTKGGTSLSTDWNPAASGNFMWRAATNFVPQALATLTNAQDTVTLKGMIWHQGESDGSNVDFSSDLGLFLASTRALVGDLAFPMALGELEQHVSSPDTDRSALNATMTAVSEADPFTGMASSTNLLTRDGVHFDTEGVIEFGIRYANLIQDIDEDQLPDDWERANLSTITNSSGGVSEDFDGDGASDYAEWRAGTHPDIVSDVLRVTPLTDGSSDYTLRWPSTTGRVYRILSRPDWDTNWSVFRTGIDATPPENEEEVSPGPLGLDIFRLELVSP